jgi:LysM domain
MPRAERLSTRLDSLLEAIFEASLDPAALYWDIAAHLRSDQLAQAQKKIRKTLRQKGEIRSESAVLVACVLHLTGFPAHRILHFLSLYVPGGIRLSLFELAVSAIFLGETPIPTSLLYDLTQYTYLEKRLLARRSVEISEQLKASLNPGVLLYLYLLSLRDDLSNENIQLIALIMKNCFPDLEVRTRIGGVSLEEYGEIARAWKLAEQRSLNLDVGPRTGAQRRGGRAFDRDSASFFLDKYFSDTSLAEMRGSAPLPAARRAIRAPVERRKRAERGEHVERKRETGAEVAALPRIAPSAAQEPPAAEARHRRSPRKRSPVKPDLPPAEDTSVSRPRGGNTAWGFLPSAPVILAAVVVGMLLVSVPMGFNRGGGVPTAAAAPAGARAAPVGATASPPEHTATSAAPAATSTAPAATLTAPAATSTAPAATLTAPAASTAGPAASSPMTTTYIVKPGDSLWKIFMSVRLQSPDHRGWMDFLSNTQSMNSLNNPDRLQPGKVLTISVQE